MSPLKINSLKSHDLSPFAIDVKRDIKNIYSYSTKMLFIYSKLYESVAYNCSTDEKRCFNVLIKLE